MAGFKLHDLAGFLAAVCCLAGMVVNLPAQADTPAPVSTQPRASTAGGRVWMSPAHLHMRSGDYEIRFAKASAWTLAAMSYRQQPVMEEIGYFQSVLNVRDTPQGPSYWIGTGHGGEVVESLLVEADGVRHRVEEEGGLDVSGNRLALVRVTKLGPYQHVSRVELSPEGLVERFTYRLAGQPMQINFMYAFMHCFSKKMEQWVAHGDEPGQTWEGRFVSDNTFTLKQHIRWAALYAPSMKLGVAYAYPQVYLGHGEMRNAFWNRPRDNKLYLSVKPPQQPGLDFGYQVSLRAFQADEDQWASRAQDIAQELMATP